MEKCHNIPITGYVIRYIKDGSQDTIKDIENVNVASGTTHAILRLVAYTNYLVTVAAVNVNGIGPFSEPMARISGEDGTCVSIHINLTTYYSYILTYVGYLCAI